MNTLQLKTQAGQMTLSLIFLIIAALAACGQATSPVEISVPQAAQLRDEGAFVLDVREPLEWQEAHIPGATLIPLGELEQRLNELPKDQQIVVYCRSGNRSRTGAEILRRNGINQASSMAGGINDWIARGFPTISGP